MKTQPDSRLIGRMRRVLMIGVPAVGLAMGLMGAVPAQQAFAQSSGGSINIGGDIAGTVAAAVSGIATHSGSSTASGGVSSEHNELSFGEQEGLAISDASGGNHNASANQ
jgi:hypothetical protein